MFGFKVDAESPNADELVFAFQMTRHGARSPYLFVEKPSVYKEPWANGLGQLTPTGERQHFLLGQKHRQKYIDNNNFLSKTFNPKEIHIVATDVNRTIMSAYSEINAWYPMGSVTKLTGNEREAALPPFAIPERDKILAELSDFPTKYGFQPMPIHVSQEIDYMLRAMDAPVCPVVTKFERLARKEVTFTDVNKRYLDNILRKVRDIWEIPEELDFTTVKPYTDTFYANWFDDRLIEKYMLDIEFIDTIIADQFYFYTFYFDEMTRIASSKFLNYVYTIMDAKIKALNTGEDDGTGILERKLIFLSAHDSTLAAMLAGVEQKQEIQPFYASHILIELYKKSGASGKEPSDYYTKWIYNDKALNITEECKPTGTCSYPEFKAYLQSREYQGDWFKACQDGERENAFTGAWYIVVGSVVGVIGLGAVLYFVIKKTFFVPTE